MKMTGEQSEFTVYPEATYQVRIDAIETGHTARSGNPQMLVKATIVGGGGEFNGRKISEFITLIPSCEWKIQQVLTSNVKDFDVTKLKDIDTDSGEFRNLLNKCVGKTSYWYVVKGVNPNTQQENNSVKSMSLDESAHIDDSPFNKPTGVGMDPRAKQTEDKAWDE